MSFGGYAPYPRRFGGGRPRLQIIHDALNAARGTALDATNPDTIVWVENMAYARAICFDGYGTNDRLAMQWDPDRMTDMLSRWEKILAIVVPPEATEQERRAEVKKRFRRFLDASGLHSRLYAKLRDELGDVFVAIEYIDVSIATIYAPNASYPWGTVQPGHPWYSTVAHILVLTQKPDGYTDGEYYEAVGKIVQITDGFLPAWCSISWYRAPTGGAAINVSGGPSQAGFYLDQTANLDNQVIDS